MFTLLRILVLIVTDTISWWNYELRYLNYICSRMICTAIRCDIIVIKAFIFLFSVNSMFIFFIKVILNLTLWTGLDEVSRFMRLTFVSAIHFCKITWNLTFFQIQGFIIWSDEITSYVCGFFFLLQKMSKSVKTSKPGSNVTNYLCRFVCK